MTSVVIIHVAMPSIDVCRSVRSEDNCRCLIGSCPTASGCHDLDRLYVIHIRSHRHAAVYRIAASEVRA